MIESNSTPQSIFEDVSRHLFTQGQRAVQDPDEVYTRCLYRAPHGLKCAIGHLIPDDKYRPDFEGLSVSSIVDQVFGCAALQFVHLLVRLQLAHDLKESWCNSSSMRSNLRCAITMWVQDEVNCGREVNALNTEFLDQLSFKDR